MGNRGGDGGKLSLLVLLLSFSNCTSVKRRIRRRERDNGL